MSITTVGVALALITGALGAFLYIEHEQSVDSQSKYTTAAVMCQADQTRLTQAKLAGESPQDISGAEASMRADCAYSIAARNARDAQESAEKKQLQKIGNALLDNETKGDNNERK
jgi:hypothetical protein